MIPIAMIKEKRPPWFYLTISKLSGYKRKVDRIDYLQKELGSMGVKTTQVYTDMPHGSGTSDSTGDLASKVGDKQTELAGLIIEVDLIEYAVGMLDKVKNLIITEKYLNENKDAYVQFCLKKNHSFRSRDTYYRLRDEAVGELAGIMGIIGQASDK